MGKIRRRFDLQFKIQICEAIESGTASIREICLQHQLLKQTVEAWSASYLNGQFQKRSPDRLNQLERENEKLKAKVGELTMLVDLLKKMENLKRQQRSEKSPIVTSKNLAQYQQPAGPLGSPPQASTTGRKNT